MVDSAICVVAVRKAIAVVAELIERYRGSGLLCVGEMWTTMPIDILFINILVSLRLSRLPPTPLYSIQPAPHLGKCSAATYLKRAGYYGQYRTYCCLFHSRRYNLRAFIILIHCVTAPANHTSSPNGRFSDCLCYNIFYLAAQRFLEKISHFMGHSIMASPKPSQSLPLLSDVTVDKGIMAGICSS
jgi:hypothetical protein